MIFQLGQIFIGFFRAGEIGLTHDFGQWCAGPVQVNSGFISRIQKSFVEAFTGVFFQVQTRDADFLCPTCHCDLYISMLGQRLIVLRNLITLGKVRIEIVFSGEDGCLIDSAVQRHGRLCGKLNRFLVQHRQCTGQSQTDWADVAVGS